MSQRNFHYRYDICLFFWWVRDVDSIFRIKPTTGENLKQISDLKMEYLICNIFIFICIKSALETDWSMGLFGCQGVLLKEISIKYNLLWNKFYEKQEETCFSYYSFFRFYGINLTKQVLWKTTKQLFWKNFIYTFFNKTCQPNSSCVSEVDDDFCNGGKFLSFSTKTDF